MSSCHMPSAYRWQSAWQTHVASVQDRNQTAELCQPGKAAYNDDTNQCSGYKGSCTALTQLISVHVLMCLCEHRPGLFVLLVYKTKIALLNVVNLEAPMLHNDSYAEKDESKTTTTFDQIAFQSSS